MTNVSNNDMNPLYRKSDSDVDEAYLITNHEPHLLTIPHLLVYTHGFPEIVLF